MLVKKYTFFVGYFKAVTYFQLLSPSPFPSLTLCSCGFFPLTSAHYFHGIWDISPKCAFQQWVTVIQPDLLVSFVILWQVVEFYEKHQNRDELETEYKWFHTNAFHQLTCKKLSWDTFAVGLKVPKFGAFFYILFCNQSLREFRQQPQARGGSVKAQTDCLNCGGITSCCRTNSSVHTSSPLARAQGSSAAELPTPTHWGHNFSKPFSSPTAAAAHVERGSVISTGDFMDTFRTTFACAALCYHSDKH